MDRPIINDFFTIQKFSGKSGWSYIELDGLKPGNRPFGMIRVKGQIDDYHIKQYNLMPLGNGNLCMPVNSIIRKEIGKETGDKVKLILFVDSSEFEIPDEIMECFEYESPETLDFFNGLPEGEKKAYINWIYSAKKEETKARRIAQMMKKLFEGKSMYEK